MPFEKSGRIKVCLDFPFSGRPSPAIRERERMAQAAVAQGARRRRLLLDVVSGRVVVMPDVDIAKRRHV